MKKKGTSHIRKYYKHYLSLILFLLLVVGIGTWLFIRHYKPVLSDRLKRQVYIASDSLYRITFTEAHLNPVLGRFTLDSFHLIPDTNTYNRLKKEHRAPPDLFDIYVGKFQLRHLHIWPLVLHKKVRVEIVKAENPVITVYHEYEPKENHKEQIRKTLSNLISGSLHSIQIHHLGLHNISLSYKNKLKPNAGDFKMKNMELVFRDILIDSSTLDDSSRFLFAKDIWFHLDAGHIYTPDSLYEIKTKGIGFSVLERSAIIKDLKIIPRETEKEFDSRLKYRKDRFVISVDSVLFGGLSFQNLQKKKWHIKKIQLLTGNVDIYLNNGLPMRPVEKVFLQEKLHQLESDILIDTLSVKNVNIKYKELNRSSGKSGYVTFERTYGTISNITNDSLQILKNKYCTANLHTLFMGHGQLHAVFNFNLSEEAGYPFTYRGHLGTLNAPVLNPATTPLGLVRIKSGRIHSMNYDFSADQQGARGAVSLKYDRLGVAVLAKNIQTGHLKKKALVSLAANLLVLNDNNIQDSLAIQRADVQYERDPYRSVFNLMWKSIFSGVKEIVGIDKKVQQQLKSLKQTGEKLKENKKDKDKKGNFFQKARKFLKKTLKDKDSLK